MKLLEPAHAWLAHLDANAEYEWLAAKSVVPLRGGRGESLIGGGRGYSLLRRVAAGKGQIIYMGWEIAASLPAGRKKTSIDDEQVFEDQMRILTRLMSSVIDPEEGGRRAYWDLGRDAIRLSAVN